MARDPDREPEVPHKGRHAQGRRSKSLILRDRVAAATGAAGLLDAIPTLVTAATGLIIIGVVVYLLRLKMVFVPGTGQFTLPDGRAAFLTYKGQQVVAVQFQHPQKLAPEMMLLLPCFILTGQTGLFGTVIGDTGLGYIVWSLWDRDGNSLFWESIWGIAQVWNNMGQPSPSGPAPVAIPIDSWVWQQKAKRFAYAVAVGGMIWMLWSRIGTAINRS